MILPCRKHYGQIEENEMSALRQRVLHHIRMAFRLGWSTPLGLAARAFANMLRVRLLLLRVA
jgi:hypothetical protein